MKNTLFLASHLYSGSSALFHLLNENIQIEGKRTGLNYDHYTSLFKLWNLKHRFNNPHNIYMDELLFNNEISHKIFYDVCDFLFVVREPKATIYSMVKYKNYNLTNSINYYTFRLKRIQTMAKYCKNYLFLNYNELSDPKCTEKLNKFLMLKTPLTKLVDIDYYKIDDFDSVINYEQTQKLEELYENTIFKLT